MQTTVVQTTTTTTTAPQPLAMEGPSAGAAAETACARCLDLLALYLCCRFLSVQVVGRTPP